MKDVAPNLHPNKIEINYFQICVLQQHLWETTATTKASTTNAIHARSTFEQIALKCKICACEMSLAGMITIYPNVY